MRENFLDLIFRRLYFLSGTMLVALEVTNWPMSPSQNIWVVTYRSAIELEWSKFKSELDAADVLSQSELRRIELELTSEGLSGASTTTLLTALTEAIMKTTGSDASICARSQRQVDNQRIAEAFHLGNLDELTLEVAPSYNIAPTTRQHSHEVGR
jgi:hypothetical protein